MSSQFGSTFSVILLSMPWATSARPSLSLGLLSSIARAKGFRCEVLYPNIFLSALMGCNGYEYFANTPSLFGVAEHLFAADIFGCERLNSDAYLMDMGRDGSGIPESVSSALFQLRDRVIPDFLDAYTQEIHRLEPDVLGLTCTFNQVMASVALAKRIKNVLPGTRIVLGGPCVHGKMGVCFSRIFMDCVDGVFLGEADHLFVDYLLALSRGGAPMRFPGLASRGEHTDETSLFDELDTLPTPDYSQYFGFRETLESEGFRLAPFHSLPFEASRGCWWGEKHHCTFCGLNNEGMRFRRKSPQRIKAELTELGQRHGTVRFMAADNILDHRAYRELLPELAKLPADLELFFEMKTNVSRENVEQLWSAGVTWVQPGIESFSDHVLRLMRKGSTALQNIQTLKWLTEFGIAISYNLLVGFPGETDADYAELLEVLPKLHHLPPPGPEAHIVQVQRFAPFYFAPLEFGIGEIRGASYYDFLIPPEVARKEEYAYFFDRDIPTDVPLHRQLSRINRALETWCSATHKTSLQLGSGFVQVKISGDGPDTFKSLDLAASVALILCDETISESTLVSRLEAAGLATGPQANEVVEGLEVDGFVLRASGKVLSLLPFEKPHSRAELDAWLWTWAGFRCKTLTSATESIVGTNPSSPRRISTSDLNKS